MLNFSGKSPAFFARAFSSRRKIVKIPKVWYNKNNSVRMAGPDHTTAKV